MHPDEKRTLALAAAVGFPVAFWLVAVEKTEVLTRPKLIALARLAATTHTKPVLLAALLAGVAAAALVIYLLHHFDRSEYGGASFRKYVRGTQLVSHSRLARRTREKVEQITVAGIPMPTKIESVHLLVAGSTGTGKSVLMREMVYAALRRGDRVIAADPNGDMLAKFYRESNGDVILNPYDNRGQGWTFFNELRNDYDYKRLALSLVPRGQTKEQEEWHQYARLLLAETARKLVDNHLRDINELFRLTTIVPPDTLKKFLADTAAESLFVGAEKALASARFVLSSKLPEHLAMPAGDFSLRDWLEQPRGNLFITWREDMAEALRPLISAWVDVLCTSLLSLDLEQSAAQRLWMFLDELASLEKLPSLKDAATKGRKAGLRIVAGLQSTAQLDDIYGRDEAQTLRSCFRSLVVLGGAKTDPKTCEDMSKSLGEHEVERDAYSRSDSFRGKTSNTQFQRTRERVVLPSEIAGLPDLTGYVAFAGDHPITKAKLEITRFKNRVPAFLERQSFEADPAAAEPAC